jgi:hypothetical protein
MKDGIGEAPQYFCENYTFMAYEVHLSRYSEDLKTELPVQSEEWAACANALGYRYVENDCIEAHSVELQGWFPVFWIGEDGTGHMKITPLMENNFYEKALEIAKYLDAFIIGEEGEIYFLPNYGVLINDVEEDSDELSFDELVRLKPQYGESYKKIIEVANEERDDEDIYVGEYLNPLEESSNQFVETPLFYIILVVLTIFLYSYFYFSKR